MLPETSRDEEAMNTQISLLAPLNTQSNESETQPLIPDGAELFVDPELQALWDHGVKNDVDFPILYRHLRARSRGFPPDVVRKIKISLSECEFDHRGALLYRKKLLIPDWEPLTTRLIQQCHDSYVTGHPGRDSTLAILSRQYFWPGISQMVRRFCRNCDICGRSHVWRERRRGLLHPLPVPERFFSELSIDFMTDLPAAKNGDPRFMMVITDRLAKTVTLEAMTSMTAEACAHRFVDCHWRFHGFPSALTSDRGSNWVSDFWSRLCDLVKIEQRLSTAFHPETDGSTERMNQEVLSYLRVFVSFAQCDWSKLLPAAMLAINNRNSSIGMSPFFITHGYHVEPIQQVNLQSRKPQKPGEQRAETFVRRLREGEQLAQAAMAANQLAMEEYANRSRKPQERFEEGDTVWLKLKNIKTPQLSRKLAWINAKYRIVRVISPHVVELDVPTNIHPRFHVELLRRAADDPLPSQVRDDEQPLPIEEIESGEPKWEIEKIIRARRKRAGKGYRRELLVKWRGYAEPDWRPRKDFLATDAYASFVKKFGKGDNVGIQDEGARTGPREGPICRHPIPSKD